MKWNKWIRKESAPRELIQALYVLGDVDTMARYMLVPFRIKARDASTQDSVTVTTLLKYYTPAGQHGKRA